MPGQLACASRGGLTSTDSCFHFTIHPNASGIPWHRSENLDESDLEIRQLVSEHSKSTWDPWVRKSGFVHLFIPFQVWRVQSSAKICWVVPIWLDRLSFFFFLHPFGKQAKASPGRQQFHQFSLKAGTRISGKAVCWLLVFVDWVGCTLVALVFFRLVVCVVCLLWLLWLSHGVSPAVWASNFWAGAFAHAVDDKGENLGFWGPHLFETLRHMKSSEVGRRSKPFKRKFLGWPNRRASFSDRPRVASGCPKIVWWWVG